MAVQDQDGQSEGNLAADQGGGVSFGDISAGMARASRASGMDGSGRSGGGSGGGGGGGVTIVYAYHFS